MLLGIIIVYFLFLYMSDWFGDTSCGIGHAFIAVGRVLAWGAALELKCYGVGERKFQVVQQRSLHELFG